jgi:hypothetical protein
MRALIDLLKTLKVSQQKLITWRTCAYYFLSSITLNHLNFICSLYITPETLISLGFILPFQDSVFSVMIKVLPGGTSRVRIIHCLMREFTRMLWLSSGSLHWMGLWLVIFSPLRKFWRTPQKICILISCSVLCHSLTPWNQSSVRHTLPLLKSVRLKDWGWPIRTSKLSPKSHNHLTKESDSLKIKPIPINSLFNYAYVLNWAVVSQSEFLLQFSALYFMNDITPCNLAFVPFRLFCIKLNRFLFSGHSVPSCFFI